MLKSCWVVRAEVAQNLVGAEVNPRKSDVGAAFDKWAGLTEEQIRAEEQAIEQRPIITNEVYETGLKLTLRMADTGNEYTRFLSLSDLDEMMFGKRFDPPFMTPELAMQFGGMLTRRTQPITIAIMDSNVDLDEVSRIPGKTDDTLDGSGQGLSSVPKDDGR